MISQIHLFQNVLVDGIFIKAHYIPQPVQLHSLGSLFHHSKGKAMSETLLGEQELSHRSCSIILASLHIKYRTMFKVNMWS